MGDRISLQFKNGNEKSVCLFSHWDGESLLGNIEIYLENLHEYLHKDCDKKINSPLARYEPDTVIIDFLKYLLNIDPNEHIESNYYLQPGPNDGDNSDNGHFIINLETFTITKEE